jgi:cobalt-zinc-cadmium efflux system protein
MRPQVHHHHHHHHHGLADIKSDATGRILVALVLNVLFTVIEFVGGWWTGSVAVMADAVHDLGDSLSLGLALYLQHKSSGKPTPEFSYGLRRLSVLSALITGVVLVAGSVLIAKEAADRLMAGSAPPFGIGMAGLAVLGLAVNGFAAWRLSSGKTQNEKMLSWHLIEDVLGWLAVLFGAIVIHFYQITWLDPVLAIFIAGFVGWNALRNLVQTVMVFLQRTPSDFNQDELRERIVRVPGVRDVHDLHAWSLDGQHHVVTLHAVIEDMKQIVQIKKEIRHLVAHQGGVHTTIEVETPQEACEENCDDHH